MFGGVNQTCAMNNKMDTGYVKHWFKCRPDQQLFITKIGRTIIEFDAPDLKREFDCCLNTLGDYIKYRSYEYNRSASNMYQQKLQKLNASKDKVREQFGQDIFQHMYSNWNSLNNYIVQEKIYRRYILPAILEKERQENEVRLNLVKKNSELYKNRLQVFRTVKLKRMLPGQIKQLIHKDKMNKE